MRTIIAGALGAIPIALLVMTTVLGLMNPLSSGPPLPFVAVIMVTMLTFSMTGVLLAMTRPGNPIGWLFLLIGLGFQLSFGLEEYAVRALVLQPGSLPGGIWAAWIAQWSLVLWLCPLPLVLLLFPEGRLPSRRWGPVLLFVAVFDVVQGLVLALRPGQFSPELLAGFSNPLGVEAIAPLVDVNPSGGLVGATFLLGALAAVVRFRRSRAIERQQLKLFAYSAGLVVTILVALLSVELVAGLVAIDLAALGDVLWPLFISSFGAVAIAVTVAILRYRLYDIDLLINRTLVYGATSATLLVTYALVVLALGTALRPLTQGGELVVAGSTLAVAALIQPVLRRVQSMVDRRFFRSRYDAERTVEGFSLRLRDEVDLDAVRVDLLSAVRQTMAPAHTSLWLRRGGRR